MIRHWKNISLIEEFSWAISMLITALLLRIGHLKIVSIKTSYLVSTIFILIGYYIVLHIAKRLKQYNITGLSMLAWSSLTIFAGDIARESDMLVVQILVLLYIPVCMYFIFMDSSK